MGALLAGLFTGLSLIVAIGAQNAFVLRMGLTRQRIGVVVALCIAADAILIFAGIGGIATLVHVAPWLLNTLRWGGVGYLIYFAATSFRRALRPATLHPADQPQQSLGRVIATTLAFTFLNPHVYIDTVLLLGSIGNQYGSSRWLFGTGAAIGSLTWFLSLGYGARAAARLAAKPVTWRVLEVVIGCVILSVATRLGVSPLPATSR